LKLSQLELCKLAKNRIVREEIFEVWKEKPIEITEKRANFLMSGVDCILAYNVLLSLS
jgi:hypothetical protein